MNLSNPTAEELDAMTLEEKFALLALCFQFLKEEGVI